MAAEETKIDYSEHEQPDAKVFYKGKVLTNPSWKIAKRDDTPITPYIEVYVSGDCNDGDDVADTFTYSLKEWEEVFPLYCALDVFIKDNHHKADEYGDMILSSAPDAEEFTLADDSEFVLPSGGGDDMDIHTLYELDAYYVDEKGARNPIELKGNVEDDPDYVDYFEGDDDEEDEEDW